MRGQQTLALLPKTQLLKDIVCSAYLRASRQTKKNPWRLITAEIDKFIFADILPREHPDYDTDIDTKFKRSVDYIRSIQKTWYDPYFLTEGMEGFPELKCAYLCPGNILVTDTTDLVIFNEKDLILCRFSNVELTPAVLYNDIRLRAQALMLSKSLGRTVTKLRNMSWEEDKTKISVRDINIHKPVEFMGKTENAILHMVNGIRNKVFYPSINEQCNSCPFNTICSF